MAQDAASGLKCPECGGPMGLESVRAGFHVGGAFAPTEIKVPICRNCGYMDPKSPEVQEGRRLAEERVRKARSTRRKEAAQEAETSAGEERRACHECGTVARHVEAKFCWRCGSPLPPRLDVAPSCAKCGEPLARYEVPVILTMDHSVSCHCDKPGFYVDVRADLPLLGCRSCKDFIVDDLARDAIKLEESRYLQKHKAPDAEEDYFDEHGSSSPPGWVPPKPVSPLAGWCLAMNPDDLF